MSGELLTEDRGGGILLATINRPDRMNAIDEALIAAMARLFDRLETDRTVRVLVLTGAGRAFCAGADLKSDFTASRSTEEALAAHMRLARLIERMTTLPQPVIAAVNGAAAGGGFALTLAADMRVAGQSASFAIANVRLGLSGAECGISWLLPRAIGLARASELMLTGRRFDAAEAERIGYLNRLTSDADLLDTALDMARAICANAPFGVQMTKEVLRKNLETASLPSAIALEARTQLLCGQSADFGEAVAAFLEKRPANFSGTT